MTDLNYPDENCEQATVLAESSLAGFHVRKACQEADSSAELPVRIRAARVTACRVTENRGVFLDLEVCCPEPTTQAPDPVVVVTAEGPSCPSWQTHARLENLHYPEGESCTDIMRRANADLMSNHYRRACEAVDPRATRSATVLVARVVECRFGKEVPGISIDVELCCEGHLFDEDVFRDLVWRRSPAEVRQSLGEPAEIRQWPEGVHWLYRLEIVRDERVYPKVTLVFVDGRVDSYYF